MIELRWYRQSPISEGQPEYVLQYRQEYRAPNMEKMTFRNYWKWYGWVIKVSDWKTVPWVK